MSGTVVVHEWRVTGQPQPAHGVEFPPYSHTWRSDQTYDDRSRTEGQRTLTAEQAARRFAEAMRGWLDGPQLSHRVVTYSEWEDA